MTARRWLPISIALLVVAPFLAEEGSETRTTPHRQRHLLFGLAYLEPTEADRQLNTTCLDVLYRLKSVDSVNFSFYAGLTATRATGTITQLTGSLDAGTLQEVTHESSGTGLGPNVLVRFDLLPAKRVFASLEASGGLILYDHAFPAGGERYNFMWRVGPSLAFKAGDSTVVGLSYRWMHVSNGQGAGPRNPGYEASGFGLQVAHRF